MKACFDTETRGEKDLPVVTGALDCAREAIEYSSMAEMLDALGLPLEGHHHSGIDDCRNLANVVRAMLRRGWKVAPTGQRDAATAA